MKLLVIGHSLIIDTNRSFWSTFAKTNNAQIDLVSPLTWSSNLKKEIEFQSNPETDSNISKIIPVEVIFKGNGSRFFYNPVSVFRILKSTRYDAIYLNQETWALSTLAFILTKLLSPNKQTALFLTVAQNLKKNKLKFLHPYERFISHFITSFLYCSEGVKEVLRWKGITTDCIYFPLPFDGEKYIITPILPSEEFKIGYLGRISSDKGIDVLLEACDQLVSENFKFKLYVAGNGPLVNLIKTKSYVHYEGLIPHNQAHMFYKKIDCFVLPSQTTPNWIEQFGRVIVESFGAGRPVIGSSSGSIPEVLKRLEWDWIFNEKSSRELAEKIKMLHDYLNEEIGINHLGRSSLININLFSQIEVSVKLYRDISKTLSLHSSK